MLGKLEREPDYTEEHFGVLTDDELYLDCVLVKPRNVTDEELKILRVWVPRYPLNKTSTIVCARQEVNSYGPDGKIAHLIFDLRGTGDSDPTEDMDFEIDLRSIKAWADERFGTEISFGFLGTPTLANGRVNMLPIRAGVVMETYYYPATSSNQGAVIYLSSYGDFGKLDDARCAVLASQGYEVYGLDPMRYLLHASVNGRIQPEDLRRDLEEVCNLISADPYLIALPISAGLGIVWAGLVNRVKGLTAIGLATPSFKAKHIFNLTKPRIFALPSYVSRIAPRPLALVWYEGSSVGGDKREFSVLYKASTDPRRVERTKEISPQFLMNILDWQKEVNGD